MVIEDSCYGPEQSSSTLTPRRRRVSGHDLSRGKVLVDQFQILKFLPVDTPLGTGLLPRIAEEGSRRAVFSRAAVAHGSFSRGRLVGPGLIVYYVSPVLAAGSPPRVSPGFPGEALTSAFRGDNMPAGTWGLMF